MIARLTPDENYDTTAARKELDQQLSVLRWKVPGGGRFEDVEIEEGAPSWWVGDEEASQSSLAAMRAMGAKV